MFTFLPQIFSIKEAGLEDAAVALLLLIKTKSENGNTQINRSL
jgi:hypothetical protein